MVISPSRSIIKDRSKFLELFILREEKHFMVVYTRQINIFSVVMDGVMSPVKTILTIYQQEILVNLMLARI